MMDGTPIISRKLDYLTDALYQGRFDPNPFYKRLPKSSPPDATVHR